MLFFVSICLNQTESYIQIDRKEGSATYSKTNKILSNFYCIFSPSCKNELLQTWFNVYNLNFEKRL